MTLTIQKAIAVYARRLPVVAIGLLLLVACTHEGLTIAPGAADAFINDVVVERAEFNTTDWTDESHSKNVDPDYAEVFDDTQVKRLDFVITPERWQSMLDDMASNYGQLGSNAVRAEAVDTGTAGSGATVPGALVPGAGGVGAAGAAGNRPQGGNTTLLTADEDPIVVPADIYYNGKQWYRVGIRFKGNSSLQSSWRAGILKLSFKMDFDEYEDDYPQINNQRFFGFKKFSLKNNFDDESLMREKIATDVFRSAGVPASHTAFYTLYVDYGNGPEYFGVYTLVEEIDDGVLDTQFSSNEGNLYKPEDGSANFVEGTFNSENFEKKTNEDDEDWSDIVSLFTALHADSTPAVWREQLELVFDVDGFLKYLAVNGIIQNWDSYGRMIHNYYLYNNPETGKLTWVAWDNNEALQTGKQGGSLALDFSNMDSTQWPLIAKIYADEVYKARYDIYLADVIANAFETSSIQAAYDNYSSLIAPYAMSEVTGFSFLESGSDFTVAVDGLKAHAASRAAAVSAYLNTQ